MCLRFNNSVNFGPFSPQPNTTKIVPPRSPITQSINHVRMQYIIATTSILGTYFFPLNIFFVWWKFFAMDRRC